MTTGLERASFADRVSAFCTDGNRKDNSRSGSVVESRRGAAADTCVTFRPDQHSTGPKQPAVPECCRAPPCRPLFIQTCFRQTGTASSWNRNHGRTTDRHRFEPAGPDQAHASCDNRAGFGMDWTEPGTVHGKTLLLRESGLPQFRLRVTDRHTQSVDDSLCQSRRL